MNYGKINTHDIANGPGVRVSLFVSGCNNHCKNCFNPETWDFEYGEKFTSKTLESIEEALKHDYISGLTILGGEPLDPNNIGIVELIIDYLKAKFPKKNIWIYTGYVLEQLPVVHQDNMDCLENVLKSIDALVDGPFVEELKDIRLAFRGSTNQRIIHNPSRYLFK